MTDRSRLAGRIMPSLPAAPTWAALAALRRGGGLGLLRSSLNGRPFLKNVSVMLTGAVAGQSLSLLAAPLLTRLYTPAQFGILSIYSGALAIFVTVATLRYELALPLAANERDAIHLTAVCGCALIATTTLFGVAVFLFPEPLIKQLWTTPIYILRVNVYQAFLVLGFLLLGGYFIGLYLATWDGQFRAIARTRLAQGIAGPASQVGLGMIGFGAPGLVLGSLAGQSAGTLSLFYRALSPRRALVRAIDWRRAAALAWRYRRFPLIASWAALIDAAGGAQLVYLIVSLEYSRSIAGFLFLSERVVARPLSLIGTSILQVFVGEAGKTRANDPEKLRARFYQVVSRQFAIAAGWIGLANLAATALFPVVFGPLWSEAAAYLQAISLAYLAQASILPVLHTLQILERQKLAAAWQLGRLVMVGAVFAAAITWEVPARWTIFAYSGAQAVCSLALFVLMAISIERLKQVEPSCTPEN